MQGPRNRFEALACVASFLGRATTEAVPQPYRCAGTYADPTGLYKMGHRYYDPTLGRFTQPDPSGQETNPYLYAVGDPVNLVDPTGLFPTPDIPDWLKNGTKKVGSVFGKYSKPADVIGLACYVNNSVRDDDPVAWQNLNRDAGQALSCQSNWAARKFRLPPLAEQFEGSVAARAGTAPTLAALRRMQPQKESNTRTRPEEDK
uniref:Putative secreted protein n=1 Tax=Streptomyces ambofaciens (strain ATCC 23877 / 3486 / DSM 40053 / JCM 4204 / NBRC 12836 / NRRL B-2516) TaxID=278992 RepID=A0AE96_STRA7|nr:RHS repeat-associated core domain-containing protein [Streptomyces ambofaciens]CAJ88805.1 putative secreted protein [Streptomyces ambofaciens ATCC 23877]